MNRVSPIIGTLLRTCTGLVILNPDHNTLGMIPLSAYEFFHVPENESLHIHGDIARTSLTYLCIRQLRAARRSNIDDMKKRLRQFLSEICRILLRKHASNPEIESSLSHLIQILLEDPNARPSSFQALHYGHGIRDGEVAAWLLETIPNG